MPLRMFDKQVHPFQSPATVLQPATKAGFIYQDADRMAVGQCCMML